MNRTIFTSFLALLVMCIVIAATSGGCANPIAPSGGPRDSIAPKLVAVTPKDSSENFNAKRVTFSFNEFVQVANIHDNLIVSPVPKLEPIVESKLRTVTVKIKDTLEANTTYSYNFGDAIRDVNEGNILKNFTYVFSTGDHIDSLELTGRVEMAETGLADSTLIVMLHRNGEDSALIKERPRFIARLDSLGRFHFRHLPAGKFYLYALKDEGGQKKYISKRQVFAFADQPVNIAAVNPPAMLYAYLEKDTSKPFTSTAPKAAASKSDKEKEKDKRLKFAMNLENGQQDLLGKLELIFPDPLKKFDSAKVQFTDESYKPLTNYSFVKDSSNKRLILSYNWPENTTFHLVVDREFAEDSSSRKIPRNDTLTFKTFKESDYGNVTIRFNNLDLAKKPVLQILQTGAVKDSARLVSKDFQIKRFRPGEYELRILFDANGNGTWDAGEFFGTRRQPEKVQAIKQKLKVKANWDNDNTIEL
ncbi:MAG: Ig-like domain-containing protein [Chitinophagaceae bacterium]